MHLGTYQWEISPVVVSKLSYLTSLNKGIKSLFWAENSNKLFIVKVQIFWEGFIWHNIYLSSGVKL